MADLHHSNVIQLVGACWEKDLMALVMEFADRGMSSAVLKEEGLNFSWDDPLLKWCMDTARALRYLHGVTYMDVKTDKLVSGVMHRDLKPDNCLVTETYTIKVADFGEARAFNENNTMTQVGTPLYIAPEIVKGDYYSTQADVFSFALTVLQWSLKGQEKLLEFLFRKLTTSKQKGQRAEGTISKPSVGRVSNAVINKGWRPHKKTLAELGIPSCVCDLICLCWLDEPEKRPSFGEIFEYLEGEAMNEIMANGTQSTGRSNTSRTNRRSSTTGSLKARINAQKRKVEVKGDSSENGREGEVDAGIKSLVELFDTDGDGIIEEGELQFAKNILHGVVKANLGKEEGGVEKYLAELKGDELKARLEEDERAEEEMAKASAQVKARLEERKKKREMLRKGLEGG